MFESIKSTELKYGLCPRLKKHTPSENTFS